MTGEHVIFIPGVLMIGGFIGFILGARAARGQLEAAQRRAEDREAAKAARAQKRAEKPAGEGKPGA